MKELVGETWTVLVEGGQIMDCILVINETVSWAKIERRQMLLFKVKFSKVYDTIN